MAYFGTRTTDMDKTAIKISANKELELEFYYQLPF